MLPWDLEDWLTEIGDQVVKKKAAQGFDALTTTERDVYEVWLFDTEARNGGVSQYFCNRGRERWAALLNVARNPRLPTLADFAGRIQGLIENAEVAYEAAVNAGDEPDTLYEQHQIQIMRELRSLVEGPNKA